MRSAAFVTTDGKRMYRFSSSDVFLLPQDQRTVRLPRGVGGIGQNDLWYGLIDQQHEDLRDTLIAIFSQAASTDADREPAGIHEIKLLSRHRKFERRTQVRRFIHEKGYCCEACGITLGTREESVWGSAFEVHHLMPFSEIAVDEERRVLATDVAILCANCHRAIHRTQYVSDINDFRNLSGFNN